MVDPDYHAGYEAGLLEQAARVQALEQELETLKSQRDRLTRAKLAAEDKTQALEQERERIRQALDERRAMFSVLARTAVDTEDRKMFAEFRDNCPSLPPAGEREETPREG